MKKVLLTTTALLFSGTVAMSNEFGRNTENLSGSAAATHSFQTGTNAINLTGGAATTVWGVKVYGNTKYDLVGKTWSGANIGVTKKLGANVYGDLWTNLNTGSQTVTAEVGFNF